MRSPSEPGRCAGAGRSAPRSPRRSCTAATSSWATGTAQVAAYSQKTGRLLWKFQAAGKVKDGLAYAGGHVFFGTYGSRVYALDARDGQAASGRSSSQPRLGASGQLLLDARGRLRPRLHRLDRREGLLVRRLDRRAPLVAVDGRLRLFLAGGLAGARLLGLLLGLVLLLRRGDRRRPLVVPGERADLRLGRPSSPAASTSRR